MPRQSSSFSASRNSPFSTVDNILILDKALEQNGQVWIENLNVIEQFLVQIVDKLGQESSLLSSTFIIRRLPTYLTPYVNKNEYAVVLEGFHYTFLPPTSNKNTLTIDRPGTSNFGQLEIFYPEPTSDDLPSLSSTTGDETLQRDILEREELINHKMAFRSHEIFKRFATAFVDAYHSELDSSQNECTEGSTESQKGNVQLIGSHLIRDVNENREVQKIFTLSQSPISMSKNNKSKCTLSVNYLKSLIKITYENTEVTVRPCFYEPKGYSRVNANVSDRLPLHHPSFLCIGESLNKGFLLFPTSFETLWTVKFWPAESHLICIYHPESVIARVFKLYASFCLNPENFWDTLNNSFLIGMDDMESFIDSSSSISLLNVEFLVSSFAYELENFSGVEDWAPRNMQTRLLHLLKTAVDCYEKSFHGHYFTKINVLRGVWKNSENFEKEEKSVLRELDDITESQENLDDYHEKELMDIDDLEDEFGLRFECLQMSEDGSNPGLTSEQVYKSINPFASGSQDPKCKSSLGAKKPGTLSKMFGAAIVKRFSNRVTRRHSDAEALPKSSRKIVPQDSIQSMTDIASGFEESIAQMRRKGSNQQDLSISVDSSETKQETETTFSQPCSSKSFYKEQGFQETQTQTFHSIYSHLFQVFNDLPPSDYLSDREQISYLAHCIKNMESQEELIVSWGQAMAEFTKPKQVCPHVFSPRQIQYLSTVIQILSCCSPNLIRVIKTSKLPSWELSGDILRTVLHQMRTEVAESESIREKHRQAGKKSSFLSRNTSRLENEEPRKSLIKFSFRKNSALACNHQDKDGKVDPGLNSIGDTQLALEEPAVAATHRLLEWLWQLRCSEIGRLSKKANKYMEELYRTSMTNSHFLEQFAERRIFQTMALRSACAVTRIMADDKFSPHVPLYAAAAKGWPWAEMILSLASWNQEKGFDMRVEVPLPEPDVETGRKCISRQVHASCMPDSMGSLKKKQVPLGSQEPDIDAATLAFHSELATPIGWNDFEDPRRPGPFTVPILIFSSMGYYSLWEKAPGNIVQVLVRLQKFNSLQHVGSMLANPHRKTALNEVRKLHKSLSFRIYNFDDNVMSKTFRRLASLRNTRRKLAKDSARSADTVRFYSCRVAGCKDHTTRTTTSAVNGTEVECTHL